MNKPNNIEIEKQIDAYLKGKLSEEEVDQLWARLLEHPEYYEHLRTELALKRHFGSPGKPSDDSEPPIIPLDEHQTNDDGEQNSSVQEAGNQWKWTMAAAAVVIIILGLNFLLPDQSQTAKQMAMATIETKSMETPDVLRSSGGEQDSQIASLISMGFSAAIDGNRDQAEAQFNDAIQQLEPPQSTMDSLSLASAHLNLGIIYYNHEEYDSATQSFQKAVQFADPSDRIREKAYWYLGNTLLNQDQLEQAREAVHTTYAINGIYREASYRLLRRLDYELGYVDYDNYEQQSRELD